MTSIPHPHDNLADARLVYKATYMRCIAVREDHGDCGELRRADEALRQALAELEVAAAEARA